MIRGRVTPQITLTPRGQLHKETVYGKRFFYEQKEEKVGTKFDKETINLVSNLKYRDALLKRLSGNEDDSKKAFGGKNAPAKNPINLDNGEVVPEKVKLVWLEEEYTIRKDVSPDNFPDQKSLAKIIDKGVRSILMSRFEAHNGDAKSAFSNLDADPIWLNKDKGISVKRVTISGVKNVEPLHYKKNHWGLDVLDKHGKKIPIDYVSTGNNHHVAIFRDPEGNLQEQIVSFYEAVARQQLGLPVIDKSYNISLGWTFLFTMKQNEMFVFPNIKTGFDPTGIDLLDPKNARIISPNLFRVQTLSIVKYENNVIRDFKFRHHLETSVKDNKELKDITYKQIKSLDPLKEILKVRLNHLGQIVQVGES
jgi:CRISPR-associated endonuclease Csn1